jgi:hypothetical protein
VLLGPYHWNTAIRQDKRCCRRILLVKELKSFNSHFKKFSVVHSDRRTEMVIRRGMDRRVVGFSPLLSESPFLCVKVFFIQRQVILRKTFSYTETRNREKVFCVQRQVILRKTGDNRLKCHLSELVLSNWFTFCSPGSDPYQSADNPSECIQRHPCHTWKTQQDGCGLWFRVKDLG